MPTPFGQVNVRDVLDILLVTFLVYQGYLLVAGTRAVNVVRGILVFAGVWVAAQVLNLPTLSYLLGRAGTVGIFALVCCSSRSCARRWNGWGGRARGTWARAARRCRTWPARWNASRNARRAR